MGKYFRVRYLVIGFLFHMAFNVQAQYFDKIVLESGVELIGLLETAIGDSADVIVVKNQKIRVPLSLIRNHEQLVNQKMGKIRLPYSFKERGFFYKIHFNVINGDGYLDVGYALGFTLGHSFHRLLRIGLGAEYDSRYSGRIFPIFLDITSYLSENRVAPYVSLKIGRSNAFIDNFKSSFLNERVYLIQPQFGLRLGAKSRLNSELFIGARLEDLKMDFNTGRENVKRHVRSIKPTIGYQMTF